ncbi:TNF receptor-associated factor 1-like [Haemaphysalis longicornis]
MACRRNLRENRQPPLKHEEGTTSFSVREEGHGATVVGTTNPLSLEAGDSNISELRSKLANVCREVEEVQDRFAELGAIKSTLRALQDTVKTEVKKMREESAAVDKRIMMKIEKIHDFLKSESDVTRDRLPPSKFEWQVKNVSKLKDQMLKGDVKSFFSDNFYVGINGYKMYLGAHFAAKNGKGKVSLSIYAYITKGPHDRSLQWPYSRRNTFVIVDQRTNAHHKAAEVVPGELQLEHCFQRPGNVPNEGTGFTAFMPLEELEDPDKGYLVNDSFLVHFITCDM